MSHTEKRLREDLAHAEQTATGLRAELARYEEAARRGLGGLSVGGLEWHIALCPDDPAVPSQKGLAGRYVAAFAAPGWPTVTLAMEDLQAMQVGLDAAEAGQIQPDELRRLAGRGKSDTHWPIKGEGS